MRAWNAAVVKAKDARKCHTVSVSQTCEVLATRSVALPALVVLLSAMQALHSKKLSCVRFPQTRDVSWGYSRSSAAVSARWRVSSSVYGASPAYPTTVITSANAPWVSAAVMLAYFRTREQLSAPCFKQQVGPIYPQLGLTVSTAS